MYKLFIGKEKHQYIKYNSPIYYIALILHVSLKANKFKMTTVYNCFRIIITFRRK